MKRVKKFNDVGMYSTFYFKGTEYFKVTDETAVGPEGQVMILEPDLIVEI